MQTPSGRPERMSDPRSGAQPGGLAVGGVHTVRRFITYILLLAMVVIAAIGLSGLLGRALGSGEATVPVDSSGLAQDLAFALIAGPLAALLWWLTWRGSAMSRDRGSVAWPLYLVLASTSAFLVATIALFSWGASLIAGHGRASGVAIPVVWGLVWLWHYWMWRHPVKAPTRLVGVAPAIASVLGLAFATGGLIAALAELVDNAVGMIATGSGSTSDDVATAVLQSLVWAAGGALAWWWHWFRAGVRDQQTGFARFLLVSIAGFASFALCAVGAVLVIDVVLLLAARVDRPLVAVLDPLPLAVASVVFGALVLTYHLRVVARQPAAVRHATVFVLSGVALVIAASGFGVTVNALLAALGTQLAGSSLSSLLLGGLSALVVGAVLWWVVWRPVSALRPERASMVGRRAYLVVIFGLSALVALITLLVLGFQLFSFLLDGSTGDGFLDRSRQAIGLLTATAFVAAYHFALWRRDLPGAADVAPARRVRHITLVASSPGADVVDAVRESSGARVTVLARADAVEAAPDAEAIVAALRDVDAVHVLVVCGADASMQVIPLVE